jgi:hypothetical protein
MACFSVSLSLLALLPVNVKMFVWTEPVVEAYLYNELTKLSFVYIYLNLLHFIYFFISCRILFLKKFIKFGT